MAKFFIKKTNKAEEIWVNKEEKTIFISVNNKLICNLCQEELGLCTQVNIQHQCEYHCCATG